MYYLGKNQNFYGEVVLTGQKKVILLFPFREKARAGTHWLRMLGCEILAQSMVLFIYTVSYRILTSRSSRNAHYLSSR